MKNLKELTKASSVWQAVHLIWQAGISSFKDGTTIEQLQDKIKHNMDNSLELARLVHDYESKIHNIARETKDLKQQNKEFKWAYRALRRENQWLKEEVFKLKGKPWK